MESKILGELFGVSIHSPISRKDVREALKRQLEFKLLLQSEGLTEEQAFLEVADIYELFFSKISKEDKESFEKIHSEEASVAPPEWFGSNLEHGNVGELYGVQIVYPFERENIREVVKNRVHLMKSMAQQKNISLYQASNDLDDLQIKFTEKLNFGDQEKFLNLMTDELIAHTNATNDETMRINQETFKAEANNQVITQVMLGIIVFCALLFFTFVFFKN